MCSRLLHHWPAWTHILMVHGCKGHTRASPLQRQTRHQRFPGGCGRRHAAPPGNGLRAGCTGDPPRAPPCPSCPRSGPTSPSHGPRSATPQQNSLSTCIQASVVTQNRTGSAVRERFQFIPNFLHQILVWNCCCPAGPRANMTLPGCPLFNSQHHEMVCKCHSNNKKPAKAA